jgi:putative phosphoesterase
MKIGIIADSHENMPMIRKAIDLFNEREVDLVCHAGDVISPIAAREFAHLEAPFVGVFGNNDGDKIHLNKKFAEIGRFHEEPYEFEFEGMKVCLMHRPMNIDALVAEGRLDLVIYGHTHETDIRTEAKPMVVNPGESGGWLNGTYTVALVDLEKRSAEILDLTEV